LLATFEERKMNMKLNNKTIVITGASDGIGKQVALKLAEGKVSLALLARNEQALKAVQAECQERGCPKVEIYLCDLRETTQISQAVNQIMADFKQVDGLLNIAGIWQKLSPIEDISAEVVADVIRTNLTGLIDCTRLLLPHLKKQAEAVIINVSSKSGVVAQAGQAVYTATKYGVRGFTEVLKIDLKGTNVRVAGVYQGGTNTQLFAKAGDQPPIEKYTQPEDLADVIVYMISRPEKIWLYDVRVEY